MKYKLIYDNGKPSEELFKNRFNLLKRLREIKKESGFYAYVDIIILNKEIDITDRIFKLLNGFD